MHRVLARMSWVCARSEHALHRTFACIGCGRAWLEQRSHLVVVCISWVCARSDLELHRILPCTSWVFVWSACALRWLRARISWVCAWNVGIVRLRHRMDIIIIAVASPAKLFRMSYGTCPEMLVQLIVLYQYALSPQMQTCKCHISNRATLEMGALGCLMNPIMATPFPQLEGALHTLPESARASMMLGLF